MENKLGHSPGLDGPLVLHLDIVNDELVLPVLQVLYLQSGVEVII